MSFIRKKQLDEWQDSSSLISYLECDENGEMGASSGQATEDFAHTTLSFTKIGEMIGQSLGLAGFEDVLVREEGKCAIFGPHNNNYIGAEYLDN